MGERLSIDAGVAKIIYDADERCLSRRGLCLTDVNSWTLDLANGRVPRGFKNMKEFEEYVLESGTAKGANNGKRLTY